MKVFSIIKSNNVHISGNTKEGANGATVKRLYKEVRGTGGIFYSTIGNFDVVVEHKNQSCKTELVLSHVDVHARRQKLGFVH